MTSLSHPLLYPQRPTKPTNVHCLIRHVDASLQARLKFINNNMYIQRIPLREASAAETCYAGIVMEGVH